METQVNTNWKLNKFTMNEDVYVIDKSATKESKMNIKQKLYNIYFDDHHKRPPTYLGTTNNLERWLKENNENRPIDEEPEKLEDFIIEDCELYFYEEFDKKSLSNLDED